MENNKAMNLYIINEVLTDYTSGMVVIAAEGIDRAREIFVDNDKFHGELDDFDCATMNGYYKIIEGVNHPEGVVAYVYGGG
jgi:hypothetical protein